MSTRPFKNSLKRLRKRVLSSAFFQKVLGVMCGLYLRFVYVTSRVEIRGDVTLIRSPAHPYIGCFWHERLVMMRFLWQGKRTCYMLASSHADGRIIAETVTFLGVKTINGSTGKDGIQAFRRMMHLIKKGEVVGLTPDGPKGPARRVSEGIVRLAEITQVPVVPMSCDISRKIHLNTWDKLIIPLPFSRCVYTLGEPIYPPKKPSSDEKRTAFRAHIEQALNITTDEPNRGFSDHRREDM